MSKVFFFSGPNYIRYDFPSKSVDPGYPLAVGPSWSGLPAEGVDAAINGGLGSTFFFAKDKFYIYDAKAEQGAVGSDPILKRWPGLTADRIDACFLNPDDRKAHFFRHDQYWRFDVATSAVEAGFPKTIASSWPGLFTADIDGALNLGDGKAYFFKAADCILYDLAAAAPVAGFPKAIATEFPGLFTTGVRAPVILGYAGFDRPEYPGDVVMNNLWSRTNLRWCSFYLADKEWKKRRRLLTGKGWGLAPIYTGAQLSVPGPSTAAGANDANDAVDLATKVGVEFPRGTAIYLALDTAGPIPDPLRDYYKAWVAGVASAGFTPGLYCPREVADQFKGFDARPVFWVTNTSKYPTGPQVKYTSPLPTPAAVHSTVNFASLWRYAQGANLLLSPTVTLPAYSFIAASMADPSAPS